MQTITPFLWFDHEAEEAATFYVSLFERSEILEVARYPEGGPVPAGTAMTVHFALDGTEFQALNAGPGHPFTDAISFYISADTQERIDELWDALTADGGEPGPCGWLKDRFGLSWQVAPALLGDLLQDPDRDKATRVMQAMMQMGKIDIEGLLRAAAA